MTTEVWKNIVIDGKVHDWYSVSNLGNIVSHLRRAPGGNSVIVVDPTFRRPIKPFRRGKENPYLRVDIRFPIDFFDEGSYSYRQSSQKNCKRTDDVHRLVMQAHRPMDDHPPDRLAEEWNQVITPDMVGQPRIPDNYKVWIAESVIVNHKDHNPTNNSDDNLEYTTPRGNNHAAVEFYGGNVANKSKQTDPIEVTWGKYNPVIQEWEDTQIDFIGKEGEKLHGMLLELAEARGLDPGETFVDILKEFAKSEGVE